MTEVAEWMKSNCLKLNTDKTEVVIFANNTSQYLTMGLQLVASQIQTHTHTQHPRQEPHDHHSGPDCHTR